MSQPASGLQANCETRSPYSPCHVQRLSLDWCHVQRLSLDWWSLHVNYATRSPYSPCHIQRLSLDWWSLHVRSLSYRLRFTIFFLPHMAVVIWRIKFVCQVFVMPTANTVMGWRWPSTFSLTPPPPPTLSQNCFLSPPLWRILVKRFCTPRLREAVEAKRGVLPRFGSKYRYSGRTLYETRVNTESRPQPFFERTASKQYINNNRTQSMDDSESATLSTNIFFIDVVFMLAERSAALGLLGRDCICQVLVSTLYSGHSCFSSLRTDSWVKRVEFVCMRWSTLKKKKKKVQVGNDSWNIPP